jgi:hypothetical protein
MSGKDKVFVQILLPEAQKNKIEGIRLLSARQAGRKVCWNRNSFY